MKRSPLRKFLKTVLISFLALVTIIILYITAVYSIPYISVNSSFQEPDNGVDIFIRSNGVHTDIVVPVSNEVIDWRNSLNPDDFFPTENPLQYVAFGWGDKGFYLYTPTWADLKFSTAFKAAFWLSSSAMHVTYYDFIPKENEASKKITISKDQYKELVEYIKNSFEQDQQGKFDLIGCCHYSGQNDNFYEGKGIYNLFFTCNTWTNRGLKKIGVKTASWTALEWGIMYHLE